MGQVETRGPQALEFLQRLLSNDVRRLPEGGAQYSVMCREDGGVLDDLFIVPAERLRVPDGDERGQPREGSRPGCSRRPRDFDVDVLDVAANFAMLAVQGPRARELVGSLSDGSLPSRMHCCERSVAGVATLVCGTGYTGEDGVELLLDPGAAPDRLGRAARRPAPRRRDSARATPFGSRSAFTSTATISARTVARSRPDSAGAARSRPDSSARRRSPRPAPPEPRRSSCPFVIDGPGIARQGNPVLGGGQVTSGTFSPCLERGIGMAYVPAGSAEPGRGSRSTCAERTGPRSSSANPCTAPTNRERDPEQWPTPAIRTTCCTTLSTTGRGSMATPRRSGSPGSRRTPSARSCSSIRPMSARRSPRTSPIPRSSR